MSARGVSCGRQGVVFASAVVAGLTGCSRSDLLEFIGDRSPDPAPSLLPPTSGGGAAAVGPSSAGRDASAPTAAADSSVDGRTEHYGDAASAGADADAVDGSVETPCPTLPPGSRTPCSPRGRVCVVSSSGCDRPSAFRCESEGWLEIAKCVGAAACPERPPREGDPCPLPGLDCFYSSSRCEASGISQCTPSGYRFVNACTPRQLLETSCNLAPVETHLVVRGAAGDYLGWPRGALAGTQMMLSFVSSPGGTVHATVVQTADAESNTASLQDAVALDEHAFSVANVGAYHDRFMIAWMQEAGRLDPWSNSQKLGIFASSLGLDGTPNAVQQLDDRLSWPGSVALGPEDDLVTFYGRDRSSLAALGATGATKTALDVFVGVEPAGIAASYAAGRFVVAAGEPGAALTSPPAGISVWFLPPPLPSPLPPASARTVGDVWSWWTLAALEDGSAMLVTAPASPGRPDLQPSGFLRVEDDGSVEALSWPPGLDGWPTVAIVPFDDGLLAFRGPAAVNDPRGLHLALLDPFATPVGAPLWLPFDGDRAVVTVAAVDRSIHVLYDADLPDDPGGRAVFRSRLVCDR